MTIAYPLKDIKSFASKGLLYQKAGIPARVVVFMGNMALLENSRGVKFPTNKENLIWAETGP